MDKIGEYTLQVMRLAGWYNNWLFSYLLPNITGNILEVGCGIGNFTDLLTRCGKVWAIDPNLDYINELKKAKTKGLNVGYGNIEKGEYFFSNTKKFDTIVCLNVLEHVKNDKGALNNMFDLLAPSGKLVLLVPAHNNLYSNFDKNLGHYRRYSTLEVRQILQKLGFKHIDVRYLNWISAIGWFIFLRITGWENIPRKEVGIFNFLGKLFLWPEKYIQLPFGLSVVAISQK